MSLKTGVLVCGMLCCLGAVVAFSAGYSRAANQKDPPRLYELRTYTTEPGPRVSGRKRHDRHQTAQHAHTRERQFSTTWDRLR